MLLARNLGRVPCAARLNTPVFRISKNREARRAGTGILVNLSLMEHAWRNATIATVLISTVPTLVLPCIPSSVSKPGSSLQRVLLCFAVGGMLGDVFLHLLPHLLIHASDGHHDHSHHDDGTLAHDHDHGHEHHRHGHHDQDDELRDDLLAGIDSQGEEHAHSHNKGDLLLPLIILGGFLFFFVSERIVRGLVGEGSTHSHSHSHGTALNNEAAKRKKDDDHTPNPDSEEPSPFGRDEGRGTKLKIAGILNLAADSLHNCSDGIAIGASFASGRGLGYSTALATLLHELPHEIGDFAVLVQSGMGKWQAIGAQFVTAIAAFVGTAVGLLATSYAGLEQPLLAATAGGFVYVSCVSVLPEILNTGPVSLWQAVVEISAMCLGIALMAGVALLE